MKNSNSKITINKSELFSDFFAKSDSRNVKHLVLHHIADKDPKSAIATLKEYQVSAHYLIAQDGEIFQLVEEQDIAYHAGVSYWKEEFNLNKSSIGIEFFCYNPEKEGYSEEQMLSGLKLCQDIIKRYNTKQQNIVAHSDIAYDRSTGFLNRKSDPSHLFDWNFLAKNGVGIYPKNKDKLEDDKIVFKLGDKDEKIKEIKEKLAKFGYKVTNFNDNFDQEFQNLVIVFNRRFNPHRYLEDKTAWFLSSFNILQDIL